MRLLSELLYCRQLPTNSLGCEPWDACGSGSLLRSPAGRGIRAFLPRRRTETSTGFAPPGSPFRHASVRIHVGSDEVLLGDSLRYVERAFAARIDARVDVDRDATRVRRQRRKVEGRCGKRWMPSARFSLRDGRLALDR